MPHLHTHAESRRRAERMRADRARGWTLRMVAQTHGVSLTHAHRVAAQVPISYPWRPWHLARLKSDPPLPAPAHLAAAVFGVR